MAGSVKMVAPAFSKKNIYTWADTLLLYLSFIISFTDTKNCRSTMDNPWQVGPVISGTSKTFTGGQGEWGIKRNTKCPGLLLACQKDKDGQSMGGKVSQQDIFAGGHGEW